MATSTQNTRRQKGGLGGAFNRTQNPLKQANARIEALEKELEIAQHQPDDATSARLILLDELRTDGDTQPRESMDPTTIEEYASRMRFDEQVGAILDPKGEAFPPILVFEAEDGSKWLADGFHRVSAAREAGIAQILARVEPGSQRDAFVRSLSVNAQHGLRRTNADKRRAVERALFDTQIVTYTDAWIAELCDVSRPFVSSQRKRLEREQSIDFQDRLLQQNGDWMEVMREPEEVEETASQTPSPEKHARKASGKGKKLREKRSRQKPTPRRSRSALTLVRISRRSMRPPLPLSSPTRRAPSTSSSLSPRSETSSLAGGCSSSSLNLRQMVSAASPSSRRSRPSVVFFPRAVCWFVHMTATSSRSSATWSA